MLQEFLSLAQSGQLTEVERIILPPKSERRVPVPQKLSDGLVGNWIRADPLLKNGIWTHQAKALEYAAEEKNVVVATGTASGKSLIFQAATFRLLEREPTATALIFYPLKALVADQLESWKRIATACGFAPDTLARLDGDVDREQRERVIEKSRLIVATPDVIHAWLMSKLAQPAHKTFLARLRMVVIDEAHVLDSVFGSNFAFFFRRLLSAARLTQRSSDPHDVQVIAASATISNPESHLKDLTGLEFVGVTEDDDGSPRHERHVLHVASAPGEESKIAEEVQRILATESQKGSFITFVDSRQGVEKLAIKTNLENSVRPYRSGYESADRSAIETALRAGHLKGVISTSALELGIDIPHFSVGLNLGVPASRKSFRQRIGRVGRTQTGCFAIIAEPYAFKRYGTTLQEYFEGSIEPSYLYLQNRFIQYAHARCLAEELDMLGVTGRKVPPGFVSWPEGFREIFDFAYVGSPAVRPRAFDSINPRGLSGRTLFAPS
jgi:DEAD/DEAH box helicase domain-containing protein